MTEKRFIPIFNGINKRVVGGKDNGQVISFMRMFELLNELDEENGQLKADKQSLIDFIKKEFPKSHKHILEGFE